MNADGALGYGLRYLSLSRAVRLSPVFWLRFGLRNESSDGFATKSSMGGVSPGYTPTQNTLFITKSVLRSSRHAVLAILVGRLPQKIATEKKAGSDFFRIQRVN